MPEDSCEDNPGNWKCKRKLKPDGGGNGNGVVTPGRGGDKGDVKTTEIPATFTTTAASTLPCAPGTIPITRPSLPEVPAQFSSLSNRLLRLMGANVGYEVKDTILCVPVMPPTKMTPPSTSSPEISTTCVPDVTWPYLPEIPAQLRDMYDDMLLAIGARTDNGGVRERDSGRCVPIVTETSVIRDDVESTITTEYGDRTTDDSESAKETLATTPLLCVPDVAVTRPNLPFEIPAQMRDIYDGILRISGTQTISEQQVQCVTTKEPVTTTKDGTGNEAARGEGAGGGTDGNTNDETTTDKTHKGYAEEDTISTDSTECIPDMPITPPWLPDIPAQLKEFTGGMLSLIGMESKSKGNERRKAKVPCLPSVVDTQETTTVAPKDSLPELPAQFQIKQRKQIR